MSFFSDRICEQRTTWRAMWPIVLRSPPCRSLQSRHPRPGTECSKLYLRQLPQVDRRHIEPKELQAIAGAHTRAGKRQAPCNVHQSDCQPDTLEASAIKPWQFNGRAGCPTALALVGRSSPAASMISR